MAKQGNTMDTLKNNRNKRAVKENERLQGENERLQRDLDAALEENRTLRLQLTQLHIRLDDMSERPDDDAPAIVGDEIVVNLFDIVSTIAKDDDNLYSVTCAKVIEKTPEELITQVQHKYINEGLDKAINLCRMKSEQARDLDVEVTAIVAESLGEAISKLKVEE